MEIDELANPRSWFPFQVAMNGHVTTNNYKHDEDKHNNKAAKWRRAICITVLCSSSVVAMSMDRRLVSYILSPWPRHGTHVGGHATLLASCLPLPFIKHLAHKKRNEYGQNLGNWLETSP
ncbi:hypothetical protein ACFE04_023805 [Oxalis oulophora]